MRVLTLGIALAAILAAARTVPAGADGRALVAPTIRFDGREKAAGGKLNMLRFSVVNPNRTSVFVFVYGFQPDPDPGKQSTVISPLYRVEVRQGGKWAPALFGWCGTGSGMEPVAPGARRFFTIEEPKGKWDSVRAGLSWSAASNDPAKTRVVWSLPVTRHELASSPSGRQAE
ncbi:MAG: hypothetical protein ACO1SX_11890 [Actinomycetota bacterium]